MIFVFLSLGIFTQKFKKDEIAMYFRSVSNSVTIKLKVIYITRSIEVFSVTLIITKFVTENFARYQT